MWDIPKIILRGKWKKNVVSCIDQWDRIENPKIDTYI